jgi:hypothetical protein
MISIEPYQHMKIIASFLLALTVVLSGCVTTPPPQWNQVSDAAEAEYQSYLAGGTASVSGQAFLTQRGGGVVKAAGRTVTLDPATSVGAEWWTKAGTKWAHRSLTPPSPGFAKARKTTVADAEGKFKFSGLAAGRYYVLTDVTWEIPGQFGTSTQGGLVGSLVEVKEGSTHRRRVEPVSPVTVCQQARPSDLNGDGVRSLRHCGSYPGPCAERLS